MDLTYLFAVVAFLGTSFELAATLTGRFVQRKDRALRKPQTTSAGCAENGRLVQQANNHRQGEVQ
ncbi:hypothetical protein [Bradyrhizobium sp.]|jgi:hypothetical protein|uniref:hypothetical protein n=1 Tax=Bradyrhizobium sp. TaxID=376 RepID=UPI002DFD59F5|nr:hypothetical protein [Bradyrhizobium sp.]